MYRSTLAVTFLFGALSLCAQSERALGHFNEISVATGIQLQLVSGSETRALISVEGGEASEVTTEISNNGLLTVRFAGGTKIKRKASVTLYSNEEISRLRVATAAAIYCSDPMAGSYMSLEGATGGRIDVALNVDELSLDLSSGSVVTLIGIARVLNSEVSSGAALHAFDLQTEKIQADCSSGGNMEIFVVDELQAKCSMGGKIVYSGEPQVAKNESSSGTVMPKLAK